MKKEREKEKRRETEKKKTVKKWLAIRVLQKNLSWQRQAG